MLKYNFCYTKDFEDLSQITENQIQLLSPLAIDHPNWNVGQKLPSVTLRGAWNERGFFLFFSVTEYESMRRYTKINDPVWTDSCVEFFIQPDMNAPTYCNFEFNSLGAFLSQTGTSRNNRVFITEEEANKVQRKFSFKIEENNPYIAKWKLNIFIPASVLKARGISLTSNKEYRANFYKCGDDLKDPHFLSWNPINCELPDFHRPDFFGIIKLNQSKE